MRFVYERLGYAALLYAGEDFGGILAAGGTQFAPGCIEPLVHGERGNAQYAGNLFGCVMIIDQPQACLLAFGQFGGVTQCHGRHLIWSS